MAEFRQIALLIDADNTQPQKMDAIVELLSQRGRIAVRRAFGNWRKQELKAWEGITKRLSIKAEQQFDYVADKNATDMALAIAALDLRHRGEYDAFAIVSSDSDFTPLAIYLRETGTYVIGIGKEQTPVAFRNSCDEFIYLEPLTPLSSPEPPTQAHVEPQVVTASAAMPPVGIPSLATVHRALRDFTHTLADADGFIACGDAGNYLQKIFPGFKIKLCGFSKLSTFLASFPDLYQLRRIGGGTTAALCYRCLGNDAAMRSPLSKDAVHVQSQGQSKAEDASQSDALVPGEDEASQVPTPSAAPRRTRKRGRRRLGKPEPESLTLTPDLSANEIHGQLRAAAELYANDEGFVPLSRAGMFIRRSHPDFMVKLSGFRSLSQLIKSHPAFYSLREKRVNGVTVFSYRCL